jgi:nucleotide-binding universal stress UspA family protein
MASGRPSPPGYGHVACCLESADAARPALGEAVRLAALSGGARLSLVHVAEPPGRFTGGRTPLSPPEDVIAAEIVAEAHSWLEALAAEVGGAEPVVLQGPEPAAEVVAWARDAGCDVLVVHPRRHGVVRLVLGSFAARLAREAPCPVMLVPAGRAGR